ncbi:MAG TPA: hypothetical protein VEG60_07715 [Candidatus Binatia bacterium]|nr:hypothetical protein [Candidatus Binatia bacterium]
MSEIRKWYPLSDAQRRAISERILGHAFLRLRAPGYGYFWGSEDDLEDVKKLWAALRRSICFGEALHNIALHLWSDDFWFDYQSRCLEFYAEEAPELKEFIRELDDIRSMSAKVLPLPVSRNGR